MRAVNNYLAIFLLIITGCVNSDLVDDPQFTKGKIKLSLSTNAVFINDSLKINIEFIASSGEKISGSGLTFSSSDENVAKINNSGYIFGINTGQATIFATAENFDKDSLLLTVVNDSNSVSSVTISGGVHSINIGETIMLVANAYNLKGDNLSNISFDWHSSDTSVLTVNQAGNVQPISPGTSTITATADNISSSPYEITVSGKTRTGMFKKNPSQDHIVSGGVKLSVNSDGTLLLEFDSEFASSGGPDIRVYLSGNQTISGNSFEVGTLKSTSGSQSYDIPSSVKINSYDWVLIHCVPFNITFGWAKLN